jgi:hypothetical protein
MRKASVRGDAGGEQRDDSRPGSAQAFDGVRVGVETTW